MADMYERYTEKSLNDLASRYFKAKSNALKSLIEKKHDLFKQKSVLEKKDYLKDYVESWEITLKSLQDKLELLKMMQKTTHGLKFYVEKEYPKMTHRPIKENTILDEVDRLIGEIKPLIRAMSTSNNFDDDAKYQKQFCQAVCDFEYITKNARALLVKSGVDKALFNEEAQVFDKKIKDNEAKINAFTYKDLEMSWEIDNFIKYCNFLTEHEKNDFGNIESFATPTNDSKILCGYQRFSTSEEFEKMLKELVGKKAFYEVGYVPYYISADSKTTVVYNMMDESTIDNKHTLDLVEELYWGFVKTFGKKYVKVGAIGETPTIPISMTFLNEIATNISLDNVINNNDRFSNQDTSRISLLPPEKMVTLLKQEYDARYAKLNNAGVKEFVDYNKKSPKNKEKALFILVNNYPACLAKTSEETKKTFATLIEKGYKVGIYFLVLQNYGIDKNEIYPPIITKKLFNEVFHLGASHDDGKTDGIEVNFLITSPIFYTRDRFHIKQEIFRVLAESNENPVLGLHSFIKNAEKERYSMKIQPYYKELIVPIGDEDGNTFNYKIEVTTNSQCAFLTGNPGSGKSSFIHSFIMSISYFYQPDEVQLYLLDFKASQKSPEFANYFQNDDGHIGRYFVPHIRYLSLENKNENSLDIIKKIESEKERRNRLFQKVHANSLVSYCESPEYKAGKLPKIPVTFFIIDEANKMLGDINTNLFENKALGKVSSEVTQLLKEIRAYGIGIIFAGQSFSEAISNSINSIASRGVFSITDDSRKLLGFINSANQNEESANVSDVGVGFISNDYGKSRHVVKIAYGRIPDKDGNDDMSKLAKEIRDKSASNPASDFIQVVTGSVELFPFDSLDSCESASYKVTNPNRPNLDQIIKRETKYFLPLGVGVSSLLSLSVAFNTKTSSSYCAFVSDTKRLILERKLFLSYLDKVKTDYKGGKFIYLGKKKQFFEDFEDYKEVFEPYGNFVAKKRNQAIEILELYDEYQRRDDSYDDDDEDEDEASFAPIVMCVSDVEFLTEYNTSLGWTKPDLSEASNNDTEVVAEPTIAEIESALGISLEGKPEMLIKAAKAEYKRRFTEVAKPAPKKASSYEDMTLDKDDVAKKFAILYANGYRYSIFIYFSSSDYGYIQNILDNAKRLCSDKGYYNNMIFDDFSSFNSHQLSTSSEPTTVYFVKEDQNARLLDYSKDKARKFWKKFE